MPRAGKPMSKSDRRRFGSWIAMAVLLTGCGGSGLTAVGSDGSARLALHIVPRVAIPSSGTLAAIEAASVSGNTLELRVSYAGGCGDHEFGLSAQRELLESTPPQVIMVLRHDGHNDSCRAGLGAELTADLRPLKALLPQGRVLRLRLYEPRASTPIASLEYAFE